MLNEQDIKYFQNVVLGHVRDIERLSQKQKFTAKELRSLEHAWNSIAFSLSGLGDDFEKMVKEKIRVLDLEKVLNCEYFSRWITDENKS